MIKAIKKGWKQLNYHTCYFCGEKDRNVIQLWKTHYMHGPRTTETWHYHRSCLDDVCCEPENYKINCVEYAQTIVDLERVMQERKSAELIRQEDARKKLKESCI